MTKEDVEARVLRWSDKPSDVMRSAISRGKEKITFTGIGWAFDIHCKKGETPEELSRVIAAAFAGQPCHEEAAKKILKSI